MRKNTIIVILLLFTITGIVCAVHFKNQRDEAFYREKKRAVIDTLMARGWPRNSILGGQ